MLAAPTELEAPHTTCLANAVHTTEQEDNCQNVIISAVNLELHVSSGMDISAEQFAGTRKAQC